jgi:hypothetical protein
MNRTKTVLLLISLAIPMLSHAQAASAPVLKTGDTWTYVDTVETGANGWRQTHEALVVTRATSDHIYYEAKQAGSTQAANELVVGADWSRVRNVNGVETTVNRPLAFPLSVGKTWEVKYSEAHPNPQHAMESLDTRFKVVGPETVEVAAGKFDAIKVEAEGEWTAQTAPVRSMGTGAVTTQAGTTVIAQTRNPVSVTATGRLYKAFWYVPETGRWVKSVEEYYNSNGVRTQRFTTELESFKRAGQ